MFENREGQRVPAVTFRTREGRLRAVQNLLEHGIDQSLTLTDGQHAVLEFAEKSTASTWSTCSTTPRAILPGPQPTSRMVRGSERPIHAGAVGIPMRREDRL